MFPYDNITPQATMGQLQDQLNGIMRSTGQQVSRHVVKVNGRAGAESYVLAPNSDDILLDQNEPIIWFIQTDGAGYKTVTPYDISPHKEISAADTMKSLEDRISKLEEEMRNGKPNYPAANGKPKQWQQRNDAGSGSDDKR